MARLEPRGWQIDALDAWVANSHRGIVSVVTGGGKTVFALACVDHLRPRSTLVVVPTAALLEQWWEEAASYFDLELDEVNIISSRQRFKDGSINVAVLNTAATRLAGKLSEVGLLVVDECHKAASDHYRKIFSIPAKASLGLSATPERPYDTGLDDVLIPALGQVIFSYGYGDALRDRVIVPFCVNNIVFDLEPERQADYDKLTRAIARSIDSNGVDDPRTVALFLKRSRTLNLSLNRIRLTIRLVAENPRRRTLVFHEDIEACDLIHQILADNGVKSGVYHSKLGLRSRAEMLRAYRQGDIDVLVTCRALDEGFNVPETEIGIIAASTATRRQRIQRLGRVVRPAEGKSEAVIYTLVASGPEIQRLQAEEESLQGVADVAWSSA